MMKNSRMKLQLMLFPMLQLGAILAFFLLPTGSVFQWIFVLLAAFFMNWNLHVSVHHRVHHPHASLVFQVLYALAASLLIGLPFHYYKLIHFQHHEFENAPEDYTSTWKRVNTGLKARSFWRYCLFWFVPTVSLKQQLASAKRQLYWKESQTYMLYFEVFLLVGFYLFLGYLQPEWALAYAFMTYGGWFLISAQNYGQHLPILNQPATTSVHWNWYNLLTLNNGLHHEHHVAPQKMYVDLHPDPELRPLQHTHLGAAKPLQLRGISRLFLLSVVVLLIIHLPRLQLTGSLDGFAAGQHPVFHDARTFDSLFGQSKFRYYWSVEPKAGANLDFLKASAAFEDAIRALQPSLEFYASSAQFKRYARLRFYSKTGSAAAFLKSASFHPKLGKLVAENQKAILLAPVVKGRKGHYRELFVQISKWGYTNVRGDGEILELHSKMQVDRFKVHDIEIVVDRLIISKEERVRLSQSLTTAMNLGKGQVFVLDSHDKLHYFSQTLMDPKTGLSYDEPAPNTFSFNSP
ncbi:MAG: hypothetical protein RLZZ301_1293, partial [Bacteroidota bacterium]